MSSEDELEKWVASLPPDSIAVGDSGVRLWSARREWVHHCKGRKEVGIVSLVGGGWVSMEVLDALLIMMAKRHIGVSVGPIRRAGATHTHILTSKAWHKICPTLGQIDRGARALEALEEKGVQLAIIPAHYHGQKWLPSLYLTEERRGMCVTSRGTREQADSMCNGLGGQWCIHELRDEVETVEYTPILLGMVDRWLREGNVKSVNEEWILEQSEARRCREIRASGLRTIRKHWNFGKVGAQRITAEEHSLECASMVTWNVGGKGLWKMRNDLAALGDQHTAILLQEIKIPKTAVKTAVKWLACAAPAYRAHMSVRKQPDRAPHQATGIVTLVHRLVSMDRVRNEVKGRLLVMEGEHRGNPIRVANVYMPADRTAASNKTRNKIWRRLRRCEGVAAGGDFNASLGSRWTGSRRVTRKRDAKLEQEIATANMCVTPGGEGKPTWCRGDLRARLDLWLTKGVQGTSRPQPLQAGHDHKALIMQAPLLDLPAPMNWAATEARGRPDMRQWDRRCEDWKHELHRQVLDEEGDPVQCGERAKEVMISEAVRIAGVQRVGGGRPAHASREQRQLRADVATLARCEEDMMLRGEIKTSRIEKLLRIAPWPGTPTATSTVCDLPWDRAVEWLRKARQSRERALRQVTDQQRRKNRQDELLRLAKLFPDAGTFQQATGSFASLTPRLWAIKAYHINAVEVRGDLTQDARGWLMKWGVQWKDTTEIDLDRWAGVTGPEVVWSQRDEGVLVAFRSPQRVWEWLSIIPDRSQARLRRVKEGVVSTIQGRLASVEAFMGNNARATYAKCRVCGDRAHTIESVTEVRGDVREQRLLCSECTGEDIFVQDLPEPPLTQGVFTEEAKIKDATRTRLGGEVSWATFKMVIRRMKKGTSPGADGLTTDMLKNAPTSYLRALFKATNAILMGASMPDAMKGALAVLLLKRQPEEDLANHRPVCLMHVAAKIVTMIITDRIVRNIDDHDLLEQSQEGGRGARSTRRQLQKLIWGITKAMEEGRELRICYIDWSNAYNMVDHEALMYILQQYGFQDDDMSLLRHLYHNSWFQVHTHSCTTARLHMGRGLRQGDSLSPVLFLLYINVLLRDLRRRGVGLRFDDGSEMWSPAFVDDIAVPVEGKRGMQSGIDTCVSFGEWAGIYLNVGKCELTGFDYKNKCAASVAGITVGGQALTVLQPTSPFKYLGGRVTMTLDWSQERAYVLRKTRSLLSELDKGNLQWGQQLRVIHMAVLPIFRYTAAFAWCRRSQLRDVSRVWLSGMVRAARLPPSTSRTLLTAPRRRGCWQTDHARVLLWEELESLVQQLAAIDDDARQQLRRDAECGLRTMGCASITDAWEEFRAYDLPDIVNKHVTLLHVWACALVNILPVWREVYPPGRQELTLRALLRRRAPSPTGNALWEQAKERVVAAGFMWAADLKKDGAWVVPRIEGVTAAMTDSLLAVLRLIDSDDVSSSTSEMSKHITTDSGQAVLNSVQPMGPQLNIDLSRDEVSARTQLDRLRRRAYPHGTRRAVREDEVLTHPRTAAPTQIMKWLQLNDAALTRAVCQARAVMMAPMDWWPAPHPKGEGWLVIADKWKTTRKGPRVQLVFLDPEAVWRTCTVCGDRRRENDDDMCPCDERAWEELGRQEEWEADSSWIPADGEHSLRATLAHTAMLDHAPIWRTATEIGQALAGCSLKRTDTAPARSPPAHRMRGDRGFMFAHFDGYRRWQKQEGTEPQLECSKASPLWTPPRPSGKVHFDLTGTDKITHPFAQSKVTERSARVRIDPVDDSDSEEEIHRPDPHDALLLENRKFHWLWAEWASDDESLISMIRDETQRIGSCQLQCLDWYFLVSLHGQLAFTDLAGMSVLTAPPFWPLRSQWPLRTKPPAAGLTMSIGVPDPSQSAGWALVWREKQPRPALKGWHLVSSLLAGHLVCRRSKWWRTGDTQRTKSKNSLELWSAWGEGQGADRETLRRALRGMEDQRVADKLAWRTVHDDHLEAYFSHSQCAHLRAHSQRLLCTDGSVKLEETEDGHTTAFLGAGVAFADASGDWGEGALGRADAYQAEGRAACMGMTVWESEPMWLGMDSLSFLTGLQAWQREEFRPSPHNPATRPILQEAVELLARREHDITLFWVKGHAGMEVNERADAMADVGTEERIPREWHETDHPGLLYRDPADEEGWMRPGLRAKRHARDESARMAVAEARESMTTTWLLRENCGRHLLGGVFQTRSQAARKMALAVTFNFPVDANLFRNNPQDQPHPWCRWCLRRGVRVAETLTHVLSVCPQFGDARTKAGKLFSEAVSSELETLLDDGWEVWWEVPAGLTGLKVQHNRHPRIGSRAEAQQPDGFARHKGKRLLAIIECTLTMDNFDDSVSRATTAKDAKYRRLRGYLRCGMAKDPGWKVTQLTFTMGCKTTVDEGVWKKNLALLGIPGKLDRVLKQGANAAAAALDLITEARWGKIVGEEPAGRRRRTKREGVG